MPPPLDGRVKHVVFGFAERTETSMVEHSFEAQVFVDVRPMDSAIGKFELFALLLGGMSKTGPEAELV